MCVCACVCVWGGYTYTLSYESSTNSLEDINCIVSISSTAISVFQICVVNLFDSIWHAERGGGGGGVVGK